MDLLDPVESITTSIPSLQGRTIQSTPFTVSCGLRCKHNWTNGSGDVFFRGTFTQQNMNNARTFISNDTPRTNVHVIHDKDFDNIEHNSRVLMLTPVFA